MTDTGQPKTPPEARDTGVESMHLSEVERMNFYSVMPCGGFDDKFQPSMSLAQTEGLAWLNFNKTANNEISSKPVDGFTVVPVVMSLLISNVKGQTTREAGLSAPPC